MNIGPTLYTTDLICSRINGTPVDDSESKTQKLNIDGDVQSDTFAIKDSAGATALAMTGPSTIDVRRTLEMADPTYGIVQAPSATDLSPVAGKTVQYVDPDNTLTAQVSDGSSSNRLSSSSRPGPKSA